MLNKRPFKNIHSALLLIDTTGEISDEERGIELVVEQGNFSPNMILKDQKKLKKKMLYLIMVI